ncbi:hypothetical protein AAZV13_07G180500 [Glycine max]|nr:hypothetical protein GYH30_019123 [Glycine max]
MCLIQCTSHGGVAPLPLGPFFVLDNNHHHVDRAIYCANKADPNLIFIEGHNNALLHEKMVKVSFSNFTVVDDAKLVLLLC